MIQTKTSRLLLVLFLVFSCFFVNAKPVQAASEGTYSKRLFNMKESAKSYGNAITSAPVSQEDNVSTGANSFLMYGQGLMMGGENLANMGGMSKEKASLLKETMGDGVISDINKGIVALYNQPASARTYVADLMKSARIIPAAQAQGLGFSALDPILETWKTFRNLAYLFFVVIFLVIGFMIMFRVQLHQSAVTAQQAIPSVIVAMLAVTFSYAIAGFMIDLMYVVMYMLAGFFTEGPKVITHNMLGLVGLMFQGTDGVQETIEQFMEDALNIGWLGEALAWLSSLLGSVIVGVAVLFASFKVFFELVKTYVAVLIQIVFSPIILMFGAIPGKNVFGKWIKDLAGNLILWPVVLLCILVQRMLTAPIRSLQGTGNTLDEAFGGGFMPPFLVGQGQASIIPVIVGLGVLLVIPEIMQQVKKAMGVDEGVFGTLAQAAGGKIKGIADKAAPMALPATMALRRGGGQALSSTFDYFDEKKNPAAARSLDSYWKTVVVGDGKKEGGKPSLLKGLQSGAGEGVELNTKIGKATSGGYFKVDEQLRALQGLGNNKNEKPKVSDDKEDKSKAPTTGK